MNVLTNRQMQKETDQEEWKQDDAGESDSDDVDSYTVAHTVHPGRTGVAAGTDAPNVLTSPVHAPAGTKKGECSGKRVPVGHGSPLCDGHGSHVRSPLGQCTFVREVCPTGRGTAGTGPEEEKGTPDTVSLAGSSEGDNFAAALCRNDVSIHDKKRSFEAHLHRQLEKLTIRSSVLRFKYDQYRRVYDAVQIGIILLSTSLTIFESIKAEWSLRSSGFQIIPMCASSAIALSASIVKFKRYTEIMEQLQRCVEKAIFVTFRLKRIQENVRAAASSAALRDVYDTYSGDTYDSLCSCLEEIERCLQLEDFVWLIRKYYDLTLQFQENEVAYERASAAFRTGLIAADSAAESAAESAADSAAVDALERGEGGYLQAHQAHQAHHACHTSYSSSGRKKQKQSRGCTIM